jgi:uncharacterized SAM-binding protein YcdF (DUF218 family)
MPQFSVGGVSAVSLQAIATVLLLPPLLLALLALLGGLLAWRRRKLAAGMVVAASLAQLVLATPFVAGQLRASLESGLDRQAVLPSPPAAVIILAGDAARSRAGLEPGALTLERMAAGVRLARRTGLPVLVSGGPFGPDDPPIASVMAKSLAEDFTLSARWVETAARDTRENAILSAALLRADGIATAWLVTHGWHMPRSLEAFSRVGFAVQPMPVRLDRIPDGRLSDWVPRPDHLATSWFMLREWAGILVYRLRDGPVPQRQ